MTDDTNSGPQPSTFVVEAGQWVLLVEQQSGLRSRSLCEVRTANNGTFTVSFPTLPGWIAESRELSAEIAHPEGRDQFVTSVTECRSGPRGHWIELTQPNVTWRHNSRRAMRADVEIAVSYSTLDCNLHPGPDHEAVVVDLSVTGMRMCSSESVRRGALIVASLPLGTGRVNVVGEVLDNSDEAGQTRINFHRLRDCDRSRLVSEVSAWSGVAPEQVLAAQLHVGTAPRHVVEAYARAGADRRN